MRYRRDINSENSQTLIFSLGSNLGNKEKNIRNAIELLRMEFGSEDACSSFYETEPWGFQADSTFINCCIVFQSNLDPFHVLERIQIIEKKLGRTQKTLEGQYESRLIDVDIIYYGDKIVNDSQLNIPHPLLYQRDFVLIPLAEILPNFIDPIRKISIAQIKENQRKKYELVQKILRNI
ncbi:MAG: 2-amino-4-hydroxy-6-hydroxymethyldihydropteridine diphosphokinase [Brumimicrobium sp.]|nr:2-amino-4-hydroxy-6-hydroxymethyldihydropteridine diphosphokinase [Brumimicrobium sp.]MCO5269766.1 2-amino-4-hydroxy-6-hydroxymethyldihydropteridine diphosphokinase [Brumimicrobium sp.]